MVYLYRKAYHAADFMQKYACRLVQSVRGIGCKSFTAFTFMQRQEALCWFGMIEENAAGMFPHFGGFLFHPSLLYHILFTIASGNTKYSCSQIALI